MGLIKTKGLDLTDEPFIKVNDELFFESIKFKNIKVEDILLIKTGGRTVVRQVVYSLNEKVITKGDEDKAYLTKPGEIIGRIVKYQRGSQTIYPQRAYLIQSTLYLAEIAKIAKVFTKAKIAYVFVKGLPLHLYYEKTHPKRIYQDCDLLVSGKEVRTRVHQLLNQRGYVLRGSSENDYSTNAENITRAPEVVYYKRIRGFPVVLDIHFEAVFMMIQLRELESFYPKKLVSELTTKLLNDSIIVTIGNERLRILPRSLLILYLALHLFHHNYRGAFRFQFIHNLIESKATQPTDFAQLWKLIQHFKLENFFSPVFFLLQKHYRTSFPKNFLKKFGNNLSWRNRLLGLETLNIFSYESRFVSGIHRFLLLFLLSPQSWFARISIIFSWEFWFIFGRMIWKRGRRFFWRLGH